MEAHPSLEGNRPCQRRKPAPGPSSTSRTPQPLPETLAVIETFVKSVLSYVKGESDTLPAENEYLGVVLAAEIAYPHAQRALELWGLAIVMWDCGAL